MSNILPLLRARLRTTYQTETTQLEQKNFKVSEVWKIGPCTGVKKFNCTFVLIESSASRTFWRAGLASPTYRKTQRTRQ